MSAARNALAFQNLDDNATLLARSLDNEDWAFTKSETDSVLSAGMDSYNPRMPAVPLYDYMHLTGEESMFPGIQFSQMAVPDIQASMPARLRAAAGLSVGLPALQQFEDPSPFTALHDHSVAGNPAAFMTPPANLPSSHRQMISPGALARQQRASADLLRGKRRRTGLTSAVPGAAAQPASVAALASAAGVDAAASGLTLSLTSPADIKAPLGATIASPSASAAESLGNGTTVVSAANSISPVTAAVRASAVSMGVVAGADVTGLATSAAAGLADLGVGLGKLDGKVADERRRKRLLRNRVSAQQARERKRNYINEMESRCRLLEQSNSDLEQSIAALEQENTALRQRMRQVVGKGAAI